MEGILQIPHSLLIFALPMKELLKKVKKLEIKTRRMVDNTFAGEYHSAFKGTGLEFDEVRPYQYGDDVRSIDWNVSARSDQMFVKLFKEERERTMFVAFDVSGSEDFGGEEGNKLRIGTEIAAILAFSALKNNDKIGLISFTDRIERFYPPEKGRTHVLSVIRGLLSTTPKSIGTNLRSAFDFVRKVLRRRSIFIVISDFIDEGYEQSLTQLSRRHEVILIRLFSPKEVMSKGSGFIPIMDAESGKLRWVNAANRAFRNNLRNSFEEIENKLEALGAKSRIDVLSINTEEDYISALEKFFRRRNTRRRRG